MHEAHISAIKLAEFREECKKRGRFAAEIAKIGR
jgi:hypothetical protein